MLDIDILIERLKNGEMLEAEELVWLCSTVKDLLIEESNVKQVEAPVTIVGDVHGQFYDLLELFRVGGWPPDTNYLFLGDYVDRGYYCVETISLLFCYKVRYPARLTLLRGNHETRSTSVVYGFYHECLMKYNNPEVWVKIMDAFDCLTISAVVGKSIFAVHGGLSPAIQDISHIKAINRFREIPKDGPFSDLMWSDPDQQFDGFTTSARGAGYQFGEDIVDVFLHRNNLRSVVRAHQLCSGGYQLLFDGKCATVWSAPNYCYRCKNEAAILEVDTDLLTTAQGRPQPRHFNVFAEAPEHARRRPKNISVVLDDSDSGGGGDSAWVTTSEMPPAPEEEHQHIPDTVRETPEYQTAWDLELWKAEEKRRFELSLERERKIYGKRLEEEGARRERERSEEFERNKAAVSKLMVMMKRNIEDMAKREEALTAKDGELNRRKSQLAIDHEKRTREFETQLRNSKEERYFDTEALNSKIRELQTENMLLKERLHKSQEDFNQVCEDFSTHKKEHVLGISKELQTDSKTQFQLQEVTKSRDELLTKYEKASTSSAKYKNQLKKLVADYNSLIELTHRRRMDFFEQERTSMRRNQILQETAAIRRMNSELKQLEGNKPPPTTIHDVTSPNSKELRWLIKEAEKSELNNVSIEIHQTKRRSKKRRPKAEPVHEQHDTLDSDEGSSEHPPVSEPISNHESGLDLVIDPTVLLMDASPLSLLKREIQNRERLITTGVMTSNDDYIKQVSQSITMKCSELGVDEADFL